MRVEDTMLVAYLAEHQVPLELCVISNLRPALSANDRETVG